MQLDFKTIPLNNASKNILFMTNLTEQKLLDAALKVFAENGYAGARTRIIAEEAGLSEMTLFRKFKTKENLFNTVLVCNQEKILKDFDSIFLKEDFENPRNSVSGPRNEVSYSTRDFFESLMDKLVDVIGNNYEYVKVFINEKCRISETVIGAFIEHLAKYIEENAYNNKINYKVLAFTVLSFIYFLIFHENHGRKTLSQDEAIKGFIDHSVLLLES